LVRLGDRPLAVVLSAAALVVAIGAWTRLAILALNPFSMRAIRVVEQWSWARIGALSPALGIALTALVAGLVLALVARGLPRARRAPTWVQALTAGLLLVGALRVLAPLRFTSYVSPAEELYNELERAQARGEPITYPIVVPGWGGWRIRYLFADEYDVRYEPPAGRAPAAYVLHGPAPPPGTAREFGPDGD
jgi:hypothetical protein